MERDVNLVVGTCLDRSLVLTVEKSMNLEGCILLASRAEITARPQYLSFAHVLERCQQSLWKETTWRQWNHDMFVMAMNWSDTRVSRCMVISSLHATGISYGYNVSDVTFKPKTTPRGIAVPIQWAFGYYCTSWREKAATAPSVIANRGPSSLVFVCIPRALETMRAFIRLTNLFSKGFILRLDRR